MTSGVAIRNVRHRHVTLSILERLMKGRFVNYDRDGEEHYNIISALHKSIVVVLSMSNL